MRLIAVTLWLLAGAALTAGVYWSFLITPESTVWSLAASALLLIAAAFLLALTISGAAVGWRHGVSTTHVRAAVLAAPGIVPAAIVAGLVWWLAGSMTDRMTLYSGPINAWFIAALGWDDVSWLFTGVRWVAGWLKWVVGPVLGLSLMGAILAEGWRGVARLSWVKRALSPVPLATATLVFAALVAAPWVYLTPWRPEGLPATSVELAFVIGKLGVCLLVMALGAALIIRQSTPTTS